MARIKKRVSYIANDAARRASFRKRKAGLVKKVHELSVLCGIEVCLIMYNPFTAEPLVWPSELAAKNTIARFKAMPGVMQTNRMVNQESFISRRLQNAQEKLMKQKKQNMEKEEMQLLYACIDGSGLHHMNPMDLDNLWLLVEKYERDVAKKIQGMSQINDLQTPSEETINPMEIIGQSSNNIGTVNSQGNMVSNDGLPSSRPSIPDAPWTNPSSLLTNLRIG